MAKWDDLVLGGTDVPRILEIDQNKCSNPLFDENYADWTALHPLMFTRSTNVAESFGDGCAVVGNQGDDNYADYTWDTGSPIANRTFLVSLRVWCDNDNGITRAVELIGSSSFGTNAVALYTYPQKNIVIATATGQTGNDITVRVHNTENPSWGYFDNVYLTEVFNDWEFEQPTDRSFLKFMKEIYGKNTLVLAEVNEFKKRWRPFYNAGYYQLNDIYETYRQKVSESTLLFCMPHKDVAWGFIGIWDKDFLRAYSFDKFIAHAGVIPITGTELL